MTVYYDPADPSDTRSKGWAGVEGSGLIGGLIGFVFFLGLGWAGPLINRLRRGTRARQPVKPNDIMLQDAARYRANQRAAERAQKKPPKN